MLGNMEAVVGTEGTTPTAAAESTAESVAAQETAETTVGTENADAGEGTTPPTDAGTGTTQDAEDTTGEEPAFVLPVQFNHENRELTLEEAQTYAQKGMQFDSMSPMLDKMRTIAAAQNISMKDMVDNLWGAFERSQMQDILREVDGDPLKAMKAMEKKRSEWNAAFEAAKSTEAQAEQDSRKALENRLMEGYMEIRDTFKKEYPEFASIPKAVVNDAIKNNRSLLDALLRYRHKEGVKIEQNKQTQQRAAAASAGSQASVNKPNEVSGSTAALLSGLNRSLY